VAESALQVELVSPARPLFRGPAAAVVAEAHDGEMGILPGHAPLVALLGTGVVRVRTPGGGGTEAFAVRGGFVQVLGGRVSLVVTQAVAASDVDRAAAEAALAKAVEGLAHPRGDDEFARLLDERRWCEAQIRIAGGR